MTLQHGRKIWDEFDYFRPTAIAAVEAASLCRTCGFRLDEHIGWGRGFLCPTYELCGYPFAQGGRWHKCRLDAGHRGNHICNRPDALYWALHDQPVGVPTEDMLPADGVPVYFGGAQGRVYGRAVLGIVPDSLAFHLCVGESK